MRLAASMVLGLCGLTLGVSCRPPDSHSKPEFLAFDGSDGGDVLPALTAVADKPQVVICNSHLGTRDNEIKKAVEVWLRALKAVSGSAPPSALNTAAPAAGTPAAIASNIAKVQIVGQDSANCDASVYQENLGGSPAYTNITAQPAVHWDINPGTWFGTYPILVHEFGHAFGLKDTYDLQQRQSGVCVAGQPRDAVMCSPFYKTPQKDDTDGVRSMYKKMLASNRQENLYNAAGESDYSHVDSSTNSDNSTIGNDTDFPDVGSISPQPTALPTIPPSSEAIKIPDPRCNYDMSISLVKPKDKNFDITSSGTVIAKIKAIPTSKALAISPELGAVTFCVGNLATCRDPHVNRFQAFLHTINRIKVYATHAALSLKPDPQSEDRSVYITAFGLINSSSNSTNSLNAGQAGRLAYCERSLSLP